MRKSLLYLSNAEFLKESLDFTDQQKSESSLKAAVVQSTEVESSLRYYFVQPQFPLFILNRLFIYHILNTFKVLQKKKPTDHA